ncbi:hypothetical protein LCGC14_0470650 [marine sediment metagenome]|uniref:Uncharacterized protein n=1 Tax=marine sediment metagenome TaxID=412755 RepID=A0A0F9UZ61_9ZZZZ
MTFWVAGAIVGTAVIGAVASGKAGKTQAKAAEKAGDLEYQMFQEQKEREAPWQEAGVNALARITAGLEPGGEFTGEFTGADLEQEPGYQFRLKEGLKSLDRQASVRGDLVSGRALKAATRYGQEYASGEYTNAFNRYQSNREARLQPLQSLAGVGQTSVGRIGAATGRYTQGATEAITGAANARASGYVGTANALTSALGTGLNYWQNQKYMKLLQSQQGTPPYMGA